MSQFLRFAVVGVIGFLVDAGILRFAIAVLGFNLYSGRVVSFLCAATVTWALNRTFTFRHRGPPAAQWFRFVSVNALGAAVNFGTYALMVVLWPLARHFPSLAVAGGSLAGMGFNYTLMKKVVFR
jgi:putative flippase GtrA